MKILAIESSCDETAAAVIGDEAEILSNVVVSQVDIFAAYGGVIPEVAARSHLEVILPVIHKALDDARCTKDDIDYIAVTYAPGLLGSLLIGTLTARMLAILWRKPLYAIHHLKSHIYSNWLEESSSSSILETRSSSPSLRVSATASSLVSSGPSKTEAEEASGEVEGMSFKSVSVESSSTKELIGGDGKKLPEFPLLAMVVSGGHTQIIYMPEHNKFEIIGTTRDDAVGECFDKVANVLGLEYPGGPSIARCAQGADLSSSQSTSLKLVTAQSSHVKCASSRCSASPRILSKNTASVHLEDSISERLSGAKKAGKVNELKPGDARKYKLPHPKIEGLDFSFSGLKTAVLRAVQAELELPITTPSYELAGHLSEQQKADFAASFQETACEILLEKLEKALEMYPEVKSVVFVGGVSANKVLREKAEETFRGKVKVYFPEVKFSGDNAAMVGAAAYYEIKFGVKPVDPYSLDILPRTPIK